MSQPTFVERIDQHLVNWRNARAGLRAYAPAHHGHGDPLRLPAVFARFNLLPAIRQQASAVYMDLGLSWHDSPDGGPSTHLRDSNVHCANALTAMIDDPDRIVAAFRHALDIGGVTQIEPGRYLTFGYTGPQPDVGRPGAGSPDRSQSPSRFDAAFLYRTPDGNQELAAIVWRFADEQISVIDPDPDDTAAVTDSDRHAFNHPSGPLRPDLISLDQLAQKPFLHLLRMVTLAWEIEADSTNGIDVVRVLHVHDPADWDYLRTVPGPVQPLIGTTLDQAWRTLLRRPGRLLAIDPAVFLNTAITSQDFADRYGHPAARQRFPGVDNAEARPSHGLPPGLWWQTADGDLHLCNTDPRSLEWTVTGHTGQRHHELEHIAPVMSEYAYIAPFGWYADRHKDWCHMEVQKPAGDSTTFARRLDCPHHVAGLNPI